ncbi:MAG: hypothetical protein ACK56F_03445, partial [bacterium]
FRRKIRRFLTCRRCCVKHCGLCVKNWLAEEGAMCLRQKLPYDCRSPKRFTLGERYSWSDLCRAKQVVFMTDF